MHWLKSDFIFPFTFWIKYVKKYKYKKQIIGNIKYAPFEPCIKMCLLSRLYLDMIEPDYIYTWYYYIMCV